ncbi:hypothetical protein HB364_27645 [Pseudoflavitalea sp. X16]|uniref:hypothetical protein n=1 Tax=Paraflavitalea devenefica TaxID=2716334 RepID=UPI00141F5412|nr:hypothetical protein [Paraflavitalea devenefica]NII28883.1 hypothetical protein [Paraflavitalea devenefica]
MKANDLIKQLEQNPEYIKKQKEQEAHLKERFAQISQIEASCIMDIQANGFTDISTLSDLLQLKQANKKLIGLLLKWLPEINNQYNSQEMIVRGLAMTKESFDGAVLVKLFDNSGSSFNLKWAIGNTIASAKVENITQWLENKLTDGEQPKENEMLVYAAIRYFPYSKSNILLRKLFSCFPLQVADAFTYIGTNDDLTFLKEQQEKYKGVVRTRIGAAIKKLSKKI